MSSLISPNKVESRVDWWCIPEGPCKVSGGTVSPEVRGRGVGGGTSRTGTMLTIRRRPFRPLLSRCHPCRSGSRLHAQSCVRCVVLVYEDPLATRIVRWVCVQIKVEGPHLSRQGFCEFSPPVSGVHSGPILPDLSRGASWTGRSDRRRVGGRVISVQQSFVPKGPGTRIVTGVRWTLVVRPGDHSYGTLERRTEVASR